MLLTALSTLSCTIVISFSSMPNNQLQRISFGSFHYYFNGLKPNEGFPCVIVYTCCKKSISRGPSFFIPLMATCARPVKIASRCMLQLRDTPVCLGSSCAITCLQVLHFLNISVRQGKEK